MDWNYEPMRDSYSIPVCFPGAGTPNHYSKQHMHYNIELLMLLSGKSVVGLYDGARKFREITVNAGEFLIINSGVIHDVLKVDAMQWLAYLPPNCLPPSLSFGIGQTPGEAIRDEGGIITALVTELYRIYRKIPHLENLPNGSAPMEMPRDKTYLPRLNLLAGSIMALCYDRMAESLVDAQCAYADVNIMKYIYSNYNNPALNTEQLCRMFGYSQSALSKLFTAKTGVGVKRYIDTLRIREATRLLQTTDDSVEAVSSVVGYDCVRTFFRVFRAHTGESPGEYRLNHRNDGTGGE